MSAGNSEGRPAGTGPASTSLLAADDITIVPRNFSGFPGLTADQAQILHNWLADSYALDRERLAYVAVVEIADGKFRRRPYLTLAAAQAAVERAEARGVKAKVGLFEIVPLGGAA